MPLQEIEIVLNVNFSDKMLCVHFFVYGIEETFDEFDAICNLQSTMVEYFLTL